MGSLGDLAVFCPYKTVAVPEGALLVCRMPPAAPPLDPRWGLVQVARRHGAWLAERSPAINALLAPLHRTQELTPAGEVVLGDPGAGAWVAVPSLLPRLCDRSVAGRRRTNYLFLLDALRDRVPAAFEQLPAGASPFVFPIEVDDKPALLARLAGHGVLGLNLWSVPHASLPATGFPDAQRRRRRTVGLPVHQELRPDDLERIIAATGLRARPQPELRLKPLAGFEAEADAWQALAERADNIFATREWLSMWWRHFGAGQARLLGCWRAGGKLAAILPLYASRVGPARALRFLGHGISDQLGPICDPAERCAVARALRRALGGGLLGGWDVLLGEEFPGQQGWSALLGATVVHHEASPVLRARGRSFEEILASGSANFRQEVGRRERKLQREHELRFRLASDRDRLQDDLTILFDLHAARWSGDESGAFSPARRAFHRDFAPLALERGWLRLWLAEVDGRPVAALYGLRFAGSELFYQAGRDPAWDRFSVGFVLLAHAIRVALEDGAVEYRLLRGDHPYKQRFADHDPGLETFVAAHGALPRAATALVASLAERDRGRHWLGRIARSGAD